VCAVLETTTAPRKRGRDPRIRGAVGCSPSRARRDDRYFVEDFPDDLAFEPVSLDFFVDELRLDAAAVRLPLLAPFAADFVAPDFLDAVDFVAAFFAPVFLDAPAFEPPRADELFAAPDFALDRAVDFEADLPALLLAPFEPDPLFVVAFAITNLLRGPLRRSRRPRRLGNSTMMGEFLKN
jgi:hypothetical protein